MISNKIIAIIFLITLSMQRATSTTPNDTLEPSSSDKSTPLVKKRRPVPKPKEVLVDTNNDMDSVEVQEESTEVISIPQELSVLQVNSQLKTLIEQGKYGMIFELGDKMNNREFLKQLCPVVETLEQYNGIVSYLKGRKMVASFYLQGNIEVVKGTITESEGYVWQSYVKDGDLETALPLALDNDNHDRVTELLDVRKGITAEEDEQLKQEGETTSFEWFVYDFLDNLAPWQGGMTLRRFLVPHEDELKDKHPDILDVLCQELVCLLSGKLHLPKAERLLVDLIGQSSLLTPVAFARGFLYHDIDMRRSDFIKYGWRETIQEGLKSECDGGGEKLWRVMQTGQPNQYPGVFPVTEEARIAICMHFPTKQQREDEWIKKYFMILFNQLNNLDFLPTVLWSIISEYAVLFVAAMDLTTLTE